MKYAQIYWLLAAVAVLATGLFTYAQVEFSDQSMSRTTYEQIRASLAEKYQDTPQNNEDITATVADLQQCTALSGIGEKTVDDIKLRIDAGRIPALITSSSVLREELGEATGGTLGLCLGVPW